MKLTTFAIIAAAMAPVAAQAELDASRWVGAELVYNAEYDEYQAVPTLGDDPFMEQLVFNDQTGEYLTQAQARAKADWEYRHILVWSDSHGEYVPRFALDPCPITVTGVTPLRVAGLF